MRKSINRSLRWLLYGLFILSATFCFGCSTTMVVTPQMEPVNNMSEYKIKGKIVYDGNKEYLPRIIIDDLVTEPFLIFTYNYTVTYGRDSTPSAIPLFNPLTIIGFPIGENTVAITGIFEIFRKKELIKSYTATCGLEVTRNLFSEGETFTELRRKGLIAVRDNIETQIYYDRDLLQK